MQAASGLPLSAGFLATELDCSGALGVCAYRDRPIDGSSDDRRCSGQMARPMREGHRRRDETASPPRPAGRRLRRPRAGGGLRRLVGLLAAPLQSAPFTLQSVPSGSRRLGVGGWHGHLPPRGPGVLRPKSGLLKGFPKSSEVLASMFSRRDPLQEADPNGLARGKTSCQREDGARRPACCWRSCQRSPSKIWATSRLDPASGGLPTLVGSQAGSRRSMWVTSPGSDAVCREGGTNCLITNVLITGQHVQAEASPRTPWRKHAEVGNLLPRARA